MGYGEEQLHDLEQTIARTDCDSVIIGTPIDLSRVVKITKPSTRVTYELQEKGKPDLGDVIDGFLDRMHDYKASSGNKSGTLVI